MEPSQQFINMVWMQFENRQHAISSQDLLKHQSQRTVFYSMSFIRMRNGYVISQTEPFSDSMLIEIDRGCDNMYFISETETSKFKRISELELSVIQGVSVLHWNVQSDSRQVYVAVKLMSPDDCVQIKLITSDEITQMVHNVCELPAHIGPDIFG